MPVNGMSRLQWGWSDMEELLQCPVCFECPTTGVVEQCRSGHHICSQCREKVENCPLCKCSYVGTRNFVVEEIMRHLEILKNIMLLTLDETPENGDGSKKKKKEKEPCVIVPKPKVRPPSTPSASKGSYPCIINSCGATYPSCRLLNHVRSSHSKYFTEGALNAEGTFKITFSLFSSNPLQIFKWQRVLFVTGVGLVFFTYVLLKSGYLIATIQMAAKRNVAQRFKCIIEVKGQRGADHRYVHNMKLISTRDKMENILYREECLLLSKRQVKTLRQQGKVNCSLELSLVREGDRFGSSYPRLSKEQLKDILWFYNVHDLNGPSTSRQVGISF